MNPETVLLDTSFLVTLLSRQRPHHETAKQHFRYSTDDGNTLFRYAQRLARESALELRCVKLQDGFDVSLINESGQREFPTP